VRFCISSSLIRAQLRKEHNFEHGIERLSNFRSVCQCCLEASSCQWVCVNYSIQCGLRGHPLFIISILSIKYLFKLVTNLYSVLLHYQIGLASNCSGRPPRKHGYHKLAAIFVSDTYPIWILSDITCYFFNFL
jgi:hypothetical protein